MYPSIKINKSNKYKVQTKSCKSIEQEYSGVITQNSTFFCSLQRNQFITDIVFEFPKFETSENLIGWEPMPDNASLN